MSKIMMNVGRAANLLRMRFEPKFNPHSFMSTLTQKPPSDAATPRVKHRIPRKKASKLLNILQKEELENLINGRVYPDIQPGDSISIDILPYTTAKMTDNIKGVVIGISNRGSDTLIKLLNTEEGTPIQRGIFKYNPLIRNITILEKAFAYRTRRIKRLKRKLYYMSELRPKLFTVK